MARSTASGRRRLRRGGAYVLGVASDLAGGAARRLQAADGGATLKGDRWVEWSFCLARMSDGPGRTLDFGADVGFLSLAAAQRGHDVVAFDRLPSALDYGHPGVTYVQGDVLTYDFGHERFDQIVNCSSIEHVGLGGRYGSSDAPDGDIGAMARLRAILVPGGRMILTVPVGRDGVYAPQHRVYGERRLARLLDGYAVVEEQYWTKQGHHWHQVGRRSALVVEGSATFYALGLFVLASQ